MKQIEGINSVAVLTRKKGKEEIPYLQTEGVNFDIFEQFDFLDWNSLKSNDIQAISKKFGVMTNLYRLKLPVKSSLTKS